jgi:hypothetical protein
LESIVESLLEEKTERRTTETLRDLASDHLPPTPSSGDIQYGTNERVPFLGLFDNAIWTRAEGKYTAKSGSDLDSPLDHDSRSATSPADELLINDSQAGYPGNSARAEKSERICQALANAIPSQEKLQEAITTNTAWWASIRKKILGPNATPEQVSLEAFVSHALSRGTPPQVAKVLQFVAKTVDEETLERLLIIVERLVLVDDEYMGTMEGLECALLQGNLYSDIGQARRAWLTYRRAITFAQIMGLNRTRLNMWQDMLWWGLFSADRFSSLMVGAPYSIADSHCNLTFGGKELPLNMTTVGFISRMAIMCGKVIDRTHATQEGSYSSLIALNNEMTQLGSKMPADYWELDDLAPVDTCLAAKWQEKALGSMIYHQLKLILHMPFMLKSVNNPEYSISRDHCFESARSLIRTYHKIRADANEHCQKGKSIDFIAFMATIALMLELLGYGNMACDPEQEEHDWKLIKSTMDTFARVSEKPFGKVAAQSYRAMLQLTQFRHMEPGRDQNSETKIVIPFFGTISVKRGQGLPISSSPSARSRHLASSVVNMGGALHQRIPMQHNQSVYQPLDSQIAYDGVYRQPTTYEPQDQAVVVESMLGYIPPALAWQNIGNFDLDQDWSWLVSDMPTSSMPPPS